MFRPFSRRAETRHSFLIIPVLFYVLEPEAVPLAVQSSSLYTEQAYFRVQW